MARGGLGAPAGPRLPPPGARGGAASRPRPAHPAREPGAGEAFLEKLKGSPSGRRASEARHRTPTSGKNPPSPNRVSPPFRWGGGRRERGARARGGGEPGEALAGTGLSQGPPGGRRRANCRKPNDPRARTRRGGRPAGSRSPPAPSGPPGPRPPGRRGPSRSPGSGRGAARQVPGAGVAPTRAAPAPERRAPTSGAARAARPPSPGLGGGGRRRHHLRRAAAAPGRAGAGGRAAPWTLIPRPRPRLPPRSAAEEPGHPGRRQRRRREQQQHMTL